MTEKPIGVGSKFWLLKTPKRIPGAILRKATTAWFSSLRCPSCIQVLRKIELAARRPADEEAGESPGVIQRFHEERLGQGQAVDHDAGQRVAIVDFDIDLERFDRPRNPGDAIGQRRLRGAVCANRRSPAQPRRPARVRRGYRRNTARRCGPIARQFDNRGYPDLSTTRPPSSRASTGRRQSAAQIDAPPNQNRGEAKRSRRRKWSAPKFPIAPKRVPQQSFSSVWTPALAVVRMFLKRFTIALRIVLSRSANRHQRFVYRPLTGNPSARLQPPRIERPERRSIRQRSARFNGTIAFSRIMSRFVTV